MSQVFSITGRGSSNYPREILNDLLKTGDFADVNLMCDDLSIIKSHRFILNSCSTVFKRILSSFNVLSNPVIFLRGLSRGVVESILEFMYLGETKVPEENIDHFFKIALELEMKDMTQTSEAHIEGKASEKTSEHENEITVGTKAETSTENNVVNTVKIENCDIYACNYCRRKFTLENGLKRHVESAHGKSELSTLNTQNHRTKNKEDEGEKHTCSQCHEKYSSKAGLAFHVKREHMAR